MSICLVNLPSPYLANQLTMPPLGLCYVSAALKNRGIKTDVLDLAKGENQLIPYAPLYAIGCTSPQLTEAYHQLHRIKETYPDAEVCLAGPHPTLMPIPSLDAGFDAVIVGEAEKSIFHFISGERGIIHEPNTVNLDSISYPDRTVIQDYKYYLGDVLCSTMITSRGCPYRCAFCCKNWSKPRYRSPMNVLGEAKQLLDMGYGGIQFYDDEFLIERERDFEIFRGLKKLGLVYRFLTRSNLVNQVTADFLAYYNCREVYLGIESGSNTILKAINKQTTVELHKRAIISLFNAGIRVKTGFVIGLPSENLDTLRETWEFCMEMESYISDWDFTILVPYPGSDIYQNPRKYDIQFNKNAIYEPYKGGEWKSVVSTSQLSAEDITEWRRVFHERFKGEVF